MTRIFVRHKVADYKVWRQAYDDFDAERKALGVTGHQVFQSLDDPNDLTIWHDFSTHQSAKNFAASPRVREVMEKAGVRGQPQIWFVNPAN
jgi:quinol monooxygenase YgiN